MSLATIVHHHDESKLSSWTWAASFAGNGLMAILAGELVRALPLQLAAPLLGIIVFIPTAIFLVIPSPGPDRRLARESFPKFFGEVFADALFGLLACALLGLILQLLRTPRSQLSQAAQ